jgi:restriction system protein
LLDRTSGIYQANDRTARFLRNDDALIRELDASEGIPKLLSLVAETTNAKRSDLIDGWADYLQSVSKFSTRSVFNDTLRRRLLNLVERDLVERDGNRYSITAHGLNYLERLPKEGFQKLSSTRTDVASAIRTHNEKQVELLREKLMALEPYAFEHFVKELLEAMDYEDVVVTKQSGDKGVDVAASFQFGITQIKEVVQVKRSEGTIGRRLIDELRGALPYHGALRGTIITLGKFARGVEQAAIFQGAAPITLIDGDRLLELVEKHEVGIQRKPAYLLEIDEAFFAARMNDEAEPDELSGVGDL